MLFPTFACSSSKVLEKKLKCESDQNDLQLSREKIGVSGCSYLRAAPECVCVLDTVTEAVALWKGGTETEDQQVYR